MPIWKDTRNGVTYCTQEAMVRLFSQANMSRFKAGKLLDMYFKANELVDNAQRFTIETYALPLLADSGSFTAQPRNDQANKLINMFIEIARNNPDMPAQTLADWETRVANNFGFGRWDPEHITLRQYEDLTEAVAQIAFWYTTTSGDDDVMTTPVTLWTNPDNGYVATGWQASPALGDFTQAAGNAANLPITSIYKYEHPDPLREKYFFVEATGDLHPRRLQGYKSAAQDDWIAMYKDRYDAQRDVTVFRSHEVVIDIFLTTGPQPLATLTAMGVGL